MADQHPFPILTQMSAYQPDLNWHGNDPILSSLSLQELNDKGCINIPLEQIPKDVRYKARKAAAVMKAPDFVSWSDPEDRTLHPVLRRANFPMTSDQDYEFLKPVLRLVSDMLARPELLGFFKGLAREHYPIDDPKAEKRLGTKPRGFRPEEIAIADKAEIQRIYEMVGRLGGCVTWSFASPFTEVTKDFIAYCLPRNGIPSGCHPEGQASFIALRPEFMAVMNGEITASQVHPELNDDSALLRSRLLLAKCMIHELAHSFNMAYSSKNEKLEPFMADEWVAETGRALEMWLLNGIMHPAGHNPFHAAAPFGLFFHKFPDGDTTYTMPVALKSMRKAGINRQSYYAINMEWVRRLFVSSFWTTEMDRFGSDLLRLPRKLGVRYRTDHQLWNDESPGPFSPHYSPTSNQWTWVQHRRVSDDWTMYRDLDEGVMRAESMYPLGEEGKLVRDALVARGGTVHSTLPDPMMIDTDIPPPPRPPKTRSPTLAPTSPMSVDPPTPEPMEGVHKDSLRSPPKPPPAVKKYSPKKPKSSSPKDPKAGPKGPPPGGAAIMVGPSTTSLTKAPMAVMVAPAPTALVLATLPAAESSPEPMEGIEGPLKSPSKPLPAPKQPSPKPIKFSPPKRPKGWRSPPSGGFTIKGAASKPKLPPMKPAPTAPMAPLKAITATPPKKSPPKKPSLLTPKELLVEPTEGVVKTSKAPTLMYGIAKTGTETKGGPTPMSGVKTTSSKPATPMSGVMKTTPLKPTAPTFVPGKPASLPGPPLATPEKPGKSKKTPPPPKKSPPALGYLGTHKVEPTTPSKPGKAPAITPTADETPSKPSKVTKKKKKASEKSKEPPPPPKKSPPKTGLGTHKATPPSPSKPGKAPAVTLTAHDTPSKAPKVTKKTKMPPTLEKLSHKAAAKYDDNSSESSPSSKSSAEDSVFGGPAVAPPETYELTVPDWMGGDDLGALTLGTGEIDDDDDMQVTEQEPPADEMDTHEPPAGATGTHEPPVDEMDRDTESDDLYKGYTSSSDSDDAPGAGDPVLPFVEKTKAIAKKSKGSWGPAIDPTLAPGTYSTLKPTGPTLKLSFSGKSILGGKIASSDKKLKDKTPSPPKFGYPYESTIAKIPPSKPFKPAPSKGAKGKKSLPPLKELSESPLDEEGLVYSNSSDSSSSSNFPSPASLLEYLKAKKESKIADDADYLIAKSEGKIADGSSENDSEDDSDSDSESDDDSEDDDALLAYYEQEKEKVEMKLAKLEAKSKSFGEKYGGYEENDWDANDKDGPPPTKKGKTHKDEPMRKKEKMGKVEKRMRVEIFLL